MIVQAVELSEDEVIVRDPIGRETFANPAGFGYCHTRNRRGVHHIVQLFGAQRCQQTRLAVFEVVHNANNCRFVIVFNP